MNNRFGRMTNKVKLQLVESFFLPVDARNRAKSLNRGFAFILHIITEYMMKFIMFPQKDKQRDV